MYIFLCIISIFLIYYYLQKLEKLKNTEEPFIGFLELLANKKYDEHLNASSLNASSLNGLSKDTLSKDTLSKDTLSKDTLSKDTPSLNNTPKIKKTKYIYLSKSNSINDIFRYKFFDKDLNNYMNLNGTIKNLKTIKLYNIKNNIIGNLINEKYNKYTFKINYYSNSNINIQFYNNLQEIKLYIDNDDKYFYIKKINKLSSSIYLFSLYIGKISYDDHTKLYKIIVYSDYKKYLNLFTIGFILIENINS